MSNKNIRILASVLTGFVLLIVGILVIVRGATMQDISDYIECPIIRLDKSYQKTIDKRFNRYLGHPDTVEIGGKLMTFYPSGHGKGAIIGQVSSDLGESWQTMDNLPQSWENSMETPCVYNIRTTAGREVLVLTSGCPYWSDIGALPDGFQSSVSFDQGETWSEFEHWYGRDMTDGKGYDGVVAMSSLTQLRDADGKPIDKWMGTFHRGPNEHGVDGGNGYTNYRTYLTLEGDRAVWSKPEPLLAAHHEIEDRYGMCELEIIRNEKDGCLILLARANRHVSNSLISYSYDEGITWSEPKELPHCLTGDRHKAELDPVSGKVLISFRQLLCNGKKFRRHAFASNDLMSEGWVAWIGDMDDLMSYADDDPSNDTYGDALLVVAKNYGGKGGADCGYSGVVCLEDGTYIMTSYGNFDALALKPYILQAKFKLSDIL